MQLQKNKMSMEFQVKKVLNGLPELSMQLFAMRSIQEMLLFRKHIQIAILIAISIMENMTSICVQTTMSQS